MDNLKSTEREPLSATERVAKLRLYLSPIALPELEAEDVVAITEESGVVEGSRFDEISDIVI